MCSKRPRRQSSATGPGLNREGAFRTPTQLVGENDFWQSFIKLENLNGSNCKVAPFYHFGQPDEWDKIVTKENLVQGVALVEETI